MKLIDEEAKQQEFSGVISLVERGKTIFEGAYGYADKSNRIENRLNTRFGIASGTKSFTALAIGQLICAGKLSLSSRVIDCISIKLPHVSPKMTIKHLLTHTSGIADYYDEEEVDDFENFFVTIPWYQLKGPKDYLPLFINEPMKFEPGERFSYANGGYILLGIIIEEITGQTYQEYVEQNIFSACQMNDSGFFALNQLPERTAYGYIKTEQGWRTNVYNLPIIGASDGGAFTTIGDMNKFWPALFAGKIIEQDLLDLFIQPYRCAGYSDKNIYYGHGFWSYNAPNQDPLYFMEGADAGVSFQSQMIKSRDLLITVISNTMNGVWPIVEVINNNLHNI